MGVAGRRRGRGRTAHDEPARGHSVCSRAMPENALVFPHAQDWVCTRATRGGRAVARAYTRVAVRRGQGPMAKRETAWICRRVWPPYLAKSERRQLFWWRRRAGSSADQSLGTRQGACALPERRKGEGDEYFGHHLRADAASAVVSTAHSSTPRVATNPPRVFQSRTYARDMEKGAGCAGDALRTPTQTADGEQAADAGEPCKVGGEGGLDPGASSGLCAW